MIALVFDPAAIADPAELAAQLGVGTLVEGVPPRYADRLTLPAAGYVVVRETWAGTDVIPGPTTAAAIAALPDPGPDPVAAARAAHDALRVTLAGDTAVVDPAVVAGALARLDAIIATGSLPALPASPTNADVVAQVRALTTALNLAADAIRDLSRIERGIIRLMT